MIRIALLHDDTLTQGGVELLDRWSAERGDRLWVDVIGPAAEEIEPLLEERFGFHELAAEDALSLHTLPKYDRFPGYDFFIFRSVNVNVAEHGVETRKMAVFLSESFLFTIHADLSIATQSVWTRLPQDHRLLKAGTDFLLYSILDVLVDLHFPILEEIEEKIEELHEIIFSSPQQWILDEVLHFKRDLNILRRNSLPQRELFNAISRGEARFVQRQHLIYFRDLYDHMYRIHESIDVERDLVASTMDAYLSVVANRTNDTMKVLTIFSSILLPVNLVAGIYGMNFEYMPELSWPNGYFFALGMMLTITVVMLTWFAKMGWILPRRRRWVGRFYARTRGMVRRSGRSVGLRL